MSEKKEDAIKNSLKFKRRMTVQIPSGTNWVNNLDSQREFDKKIT